MNQQGGPIFEGMPSPSLRRMRRMSRSELGAHASKLSSEAELVEARLVQLRERAEPPYDKLDRLSKLQHRLQALAEEARRLGRYARD
jgi:hypothetical protein